ncbi:Tn3 family transposase [Streptomyces sp. MNU89]|uniref:Tn3 family transposase n=1 Tax=Streptomyces sp. MNU89 TaxID=2560025 RepID=UPI0022832B2E|nr:Tn3 family transposase [Streptomyces sp. MNU89]
MFLVLREVSRSILVMRPAPSYPRAGALLTRRLNTEVIADMRDDLLRVAASVQGGHATAALVVGKLCSSKRRQNALTSAIKEYGALRRTVYATRYLADETYRRRITRQLNQGENLHALRRSLAYADEGARCSAGIMSSRASRCGA